MKTINHSFTLESGAELKEVVKKRYEAIRRGEDIPNSIYSDIFGDLSNYSLDGSIELNGLNVSSLKGVPVYISRSFQIDFATDLKDLEGCPRAVGHSFSVEHCDNLKTLKGISGLEIRTNSGNSAILYLRHNSKLTDISDLNQKTLDMCQLIYLAGSPVSVVDIVKIMSSKRKNDGSWGFLNSDYKISELDRLYFIYKKLDFDHKKFDRALELL